MASSSSGHDDESEHHYRHSKKKAEEQDGGGFRSDYLCLLESERQISSSDLPRRPNGKESVEGLRVLGSWKVWEE